ncbi:hypothetical protein SCLCIDRAFT_1212160 [Scleroderma citrinum Foug A]|uniref:Uncharacterized protein n=1 Tax=Scleroderma citrinum Foug A TaxID=1036808 RepID=A0A0C3EAQ3_9AGAM|nr:hypothetical protein SCLCIDRAFT_1212160 [Scleroderma citrinum Foug A]
MTLPRSEMIFGPNQTTSGLSTGQQTIVSSLVGTLGFNNTCEQLTDNPTADSIPSLLRHQAQASHRSWLVYVHRTMILGCGAPLDAPSGCPSSPVIVTQ